AERSRYLLSLSSDRPGVVARLQPIDDAANQLLGLIRVSIDEAESITARAEEPSQGTDPDRASVLVVDDNDVNRALLARPLERLGYRVSTAANGREALHLLQQADIDLVLLDVLMPEMDG